MDIRESLGIEDFRLVEKELITKCIAEANMQKSMGPSEIHPCMLRELTEVTAKLLSVIFERSWKMEDVPEG